MEQARQGRREFWKERSTSSRATLRSNKAQWVLFWFCSLGGVRPLSHDLSGRGWGEASCRGVRPEWEASTWRERQSDHLGLREERGRARATASWLLFENVDKHEHSFGLGGESRQKKIKGRKRIILEELRKGGNKAEMEG